VGFYKLQVQLKLWALIFCTEREKGTTAKYIKEEKKRFAILQKKCNAEENT
jgi:hypothetical protein